MGAEEEVVAWRREEEGVRALLVGSGFVEEADALLNAEKVPRGAPPKRPSPCRCFSKPPDACESLASPPYTGAPVASDVRASSNAAYVKPLSRIAAAGLMVGNSISALSALGSSVNATVPAVRSSRISTSLHTLALPVTNSVLIHSLYAASLFEGGVMVAEGATYRARERKLHACALLAKGLRTARCHQASLNLQHCQRRASGFSYEP